MNATGAPPLEVPSRPLWRVVLPFALALALVLAVLSQLDLGAFVRSLRQVSGLHLVGVGLAFSGSLLVADSIATVPVYRRLVGPLRYRDFMTFRGASYLPSFVNHHLGQVALAWMLHEAYGFTVWRVAAATLVSYASWGGCLLGAGCLSLVVSRERLGWLVLPLGMGLAYLGVLAWKPDFLVRRLALAPLFEAGVSGHLVALFVRIPHMLVMFVGTWASYAIFDVRVPFAAALRYIPLLMIAVTLPITPQGFGTRDAVSALFFVSYAPGATQPQRLASVVAATTAWGVMNTVFEAGIGIACARMASRKVGKQRVQA